MLARERQKFRLKHDALFNLHELTYDLVGFIANIITYPDLVVICGLNLFVNELDKVLYTSAQTPQLVSYDTTFQLGDSRKVLLSLFRKLHSCMLLLWIQGNVSHNTKLVGVFTMHMQSDFSQQKVALVHLLLPATTFWLPN